MEIAMVLVLVSVFVGGIVAMRRAGWFEDSDDRVVERARAMGHALSDDTVGPHGG